MDIARLMREPAASFSISRKMRYTDSIIGPTMKIYTILILIVTLGSGICRAAEPSFDCARAGAEAEVAVCSSNALADLDLEMARLYMLALNGPHATDESRRYLKATQRGWIKGRNECWKKGRDLALCVANSYAFRIHEIRDLYADARREDNEKSSGSFPYRCEGFEPTIGAVFINTVEPLVSLKWAGNWIILPRVPSGSGAKYTSDYWNTLASGGYSGINALFWIHGEEAVFAPPGGPEFTCMRDEIG